MTPSALPAMGVAAHGSGLGWRQELGGAIDGYETKYFQTLRKYN
jgi:hypothetical protein